MLTRAVLMTSSQSKAYSRNVALYGGGCIHSNIAPRSPHGPEHCHYFSPCADKDPTTSFVGNECVGSTTGIRCWNCTPGVDCATVAENRYYIGGGNGSAVCSTGGLERGSTTLPLPPDAQAVAMAKAALGMV